LPVRDITGPLLIYLNHASWWDPLICLLLARRFFANRTSYAPIDAGMLQRYGFLKRLGFYGISEGSSQGARKFLSVSSSLLTSDYAALWLTPQGRFADARERPIDLRPGIGYLATNLPNVCFLPLALEYSFWTEPQPEALVAFGKPIIPGTLGHRHNAGWTHIFGVVLQQLQQRLAEKSIQRVANDWMLLEKGTEGIAPVYDAGRWLWAKMTRQRFIRGHSGDALR
jgi:1-acyl-sn-glycerol-3-phosphate acyltransferase